jgi:hypothetical protein
MEFLLAWKKDRTPELPAAQDLPVLIDPTFAFAQIMGDLLNRHYPILIIFIKG